MSHRILEIVMAALHDVRASIRIAGSPGSLCRLWADFAGRRCMRLIPPSRRNKVRVAFLKGGSRIAYRLNLGDLQGIREVWMDGAYCPPFPTTPKIVVDLGANIGLTSVWCHQRWHCEQIVAVEADAANAELTAKNFAMNSIPGEVIHAAVGSSDGWTCFSKSDMSNTGHVTLGAETGEDSKNIVKVPMVSMPTVLGHLPAGRQVDILKVDIEGGEGVLFNGDLDWLNRVDAIVIELHDDQTDTSRVADNIIARGFKFIPSGSVFPDSVTAFVRTGRHSLET